MNAKTSSDEGSLFGQLVDEFLERLRMRENPNPEEYAIRYPELASQIRELFPTLHLLEAFGSVPTSPRNATIPLQLGEFRILRQVARGGMGIVYEAVQESLGRHVALKVLDPTGAGSADRETRFLREAQSAARLHHSNIVPVFAVGEQDGTFYYAMQFIQGQTLWAVLAELREPSPGTPSPTTVTLLGPPDDTHFTLAEPSSQLSQHGPHHQAYFANIARIGSQIADALDYAHREGVIHRDVKPSNLLLDANGVPWVTDFGLAKVTLDEGLTETGAILGTLAYMAPEQFAGEATALSDVYGLGVTLYELATLRPAFSDDNKLRLMDRVRSQTPPAPRSLDPAIPRDLETIILKAMAKEPTRRYATAGELAADLRRFLEGRSVLARRSSWIGQTWRWCKRNRAVAALLTALLTSLVVLAVGATTVAVRNERQKNEANERAWRAKLDEAEAVAGSDRLGQRFGALRLLQVALTEARVRGLTPDDEVRFRSVAASALCRPDLELERTWGEYHPRTYGWEFEVDFHPALDEYATVGPGKLVTIRRIADDALLAELPVRKLPASVLYSPDGSALAVLDGMKSPANHLDVWVKSGDGWTKRGSVFGHLSEYFAFSSDGTRLAYLKVPSSSVCVLDWSTNKQWEKRLSKAINYRWRICFSTDGRVTFPDPERDGKRLLAWAVGSEPVVLPVPVTSDPNRLNWDDDSRTISLGMNNRSAIAFDADTGQALGPPLIHPSDGVVPTPVGVHGRLLTCDWTNRLRLWDLPTGRQLFNVPSLGSIIRRGSNGERIALLSDQPDGRHRLFRLNAGGELSRVVYRDPTNRTAGVGTMGCWFSPVDGLCVVGLNAMNTDTNAGGFLLLDRRSGRILESYAEAPERPLQFLADGSLLTVSQAGVRKWPRRATGDGVQFGPPEVTLPEAGQATVIQTSRTSEAGRVVAAVSANDSKIVRVMKADPTVEQIIRTPSRLHRINVSPDGRWLLSGAESTKPLGPNVLVYDLRTGERFAELNIDGKARVGFSPDGRWAWASGIGGNARLWRTDTWEPGPVVGGHTVAFTADGQLAAANDGAGVIRFFEPETGRTIVRIRLPESDFLWPLAFDPSGSHLTAYCPDSWMMVILDVGKIRRELANLGLDWSSPTVAPLPVPQNVYLDPGTPENRRLATTRLREGRFADAARRLQWIIRDAPDDAPALLDLARLRLIGPRESLDFAEGNGCVEKLMQLVPKHASVPPTAQEKITLQHVQVVRAAADFRAGNYPAARDRLVPDPRGNSSAISRLLMAMCLHHLGDAEAAKRELAEEDRLAKIAAKSVKLYASVYPWTASDESLRAEAVALIRKP